ncbi:MAG TPA: M23 family metallopeptidase [Kofleriaceae bacterium]|nr:M23 family metallopeptidase [Kofleriaceae bacterium]
MRASWIVVALALVPFAGDAKTKPRAVAAPAKSAVDPRVALAAQIAAEQQTLATTTETVAGKLAAADATRAHRVLAAIRIAEAPDRADHDPMAAARRIAAARYLLAGDAAERGLLADELAQLHGAAHEVTAAAASIATVALPDHLGWPAAGTIARHFGEYQHERSKATLSRRGLDIEVDDHAAAEAPADGVVRFAGPIRGLDRGVVIDHGGYFTVIAKLGELATLAGAHVGKGDRLGRAARHRIYFEVRAKVGPGGLPIDPEPLLGPR